MPSERSNTRVISGRTDSSHLQGRQIRTQAAEAAEVKRKEEYDRRRARALMLEARAHGLLGHNRRRGIELAQSSYAIYPSVEGAREAARWLSAAGKDAEAMQYLADAFTIAGLRSADPDGAGDRARMSELYRKLHGSEAGLGDLILKGLRRHFRQLAAAPRRIAPVRSQRADQGPDAIHALGLGRRQTAAFARSWAK